MNRALATHVLDTLFDADIRELCLCAGARNSPLVSLASRDTRFRTYNLFEERSAAFFALGRIKATDRPVAVVTTSGTAAGELLPATMEAYYSGLPLVLVTADRPRRFRGSGAPQTAEQVGLFGVYAELGFDLAGSERADISSWSRARPLHLNVCFEEPLPGLSGASEERILPLPTPVLPDTNAQYAAAEARARLRGFLERSHAPLVIVGALTPQERPPALDFLRALGTPVILESLSGLREHPALQSLSLRGGNTALVPKQGDTPPWMDGVLRLGSVPTLRLWRDLEDTLSHLPLLSLSAQPFAGTSRGELVHGPLDPILGQLASEVTPLRRDERIEALIARAHAWDRALTDLLAAEPRSEPGLIYQLSQSVPSGARVFLGNSLPIREWDLAATHAPRGFEMGASRGLNGIDGQMSTFFGFSREECENWALLGDLTALYDMSAPWILSQMPAVRAHVAILNNGGGKIFDRMFPDPVFQNSHALVFEHLARFWDLDYARWETVPASLPAGGRGRSLIEIVPDPDATQRFWRAHDALASKGDVS